MMDQSIKFDLELINRYDRAGPRYTSYPTALELHEGFGDKEYRQHIAKSNAAGGPLSLYFHIPFCDTVCFYCACNKIITKNRKHAEPYLANLCKEIAMQGDLFDSNRIVKLTVTYAGRAPLGEKVAVRAELLDTVVIRVRDVNVARAVNGEGFRRVKLTVTRAGGAPRGEKVAVGGKLLDAVVRLIRNVNIV